MRRTELRGAKMNTTKRAAALGLAATMGVAAAVGWGCGETGDTDPTPVQTFKITPAANVTPSPAASVVVNTPTAPPSPPAGDGHEITIAGISSEFDVEEIEAPPGTLTVIFDNRDAGIVHNIHFFKGDDNDGEDIAETELEVGPIEQTLTFEVEPGEYFYQCDAHPTTMSGTLIVR
jgi:plastocyanin